MQTLVFTNQKGGVAKTSSSYALACGLHIRGKRILLVDLDPQSNLSYTVGLDDTNEWTLYDCFKGNCSVEDCKQTIKEGLDILSIGLQATAADIELSSRTAREYILKKELSNQDYDYCIIDTSPSLGLLTLNALTAANLVIIPTAAEIYSLQGLSQLGGFIENVKEFTNKDLKISGLLLTRYNERLNLTQALQENIEQAAKILNTVVYDTKIRESVAVKETQLLRGNIFDEAPKAKATLDYTAFIDEFLSKEE